MCKEKEIIEEQGRLIQKTLRPQTIEKIQEYAEKIKKFSDNLKDTNLYNLKEDIKNHNNQLTDDDLHIKFINLQAGLLQEKNKIKSFIIYSPENTVLRNFKEVSAIEPLGDKGEGLLKLLTVIQHEAQDSETDKEAFDDIQETLELFDWYESVEVPSELSPLERKITIQDRYLEMPFDQRSANEGFLLVLFYITLVVSKYTPKIFAIDNIDTSLNPRPVQN